MECDFTGVDMLYNGPEARWVLEINRYGRFKGFEQVTQIDVASALLDWIGSKLR